VKYSINDTKRRAVSLRQLQV